MNLLNVAFLVCNSILIGSLVYATIMLIALFREDKHTESFDDYLDKLDEIIYEEILYDNNFNIYAKDKFSSRREYVSATIIEAEYNVI